jgi:NAD(P)-dependent dehydrogenase (short-subunit alcohol dehydrogenase family)
VSRLDGQVAVVTGSGRGLGRAYALALAKEGAAVLVNDRDKEPAVAVVNEIRAAGGTADACVEAVGSREAAAHIVQTARDAFGRIDTMITNAGADRRGLVLDLSDEDFEFTLRTHVFGSLYCSIEAARVMRDQGSGGAIMNVTSDAFHMGVTTLAPYCISKGAIYGLTRLLAGELAPLGISVNAIAPPSTRTEPMMAFADSLAGMGVDEDGVAAFKAMIQEPEDVAPLAVFLASDAGRKLTGRVFGLTHQDFTELKPPSHDSLGHQADGPWTVDELIAAAADLT